MADASLVPSLNEDVHFVICDSAVRALPMLRPTPPRLTPPPSFRIYCMANTNPDAGPSAQCG